MPLREVVVRTFACLLDVVRMVTIRLVPPCRPSWCRKGSASVELLVGSDLVIALVLAAAIALTILSLRLTRR